MKPRLWHVIAATIALAGALSAFGQASVITPPKVIDVTNSQGVVKSAVMPVPVTNYFANTFVGIPTNNGLKGYDFVPIYVQHSTNPATGYTNIYTAWTNGPFSVQMRFTNGSHFYRAQWGSNGAIRAGM